MKFKIGQSVIANRNIEHPKNKYCAGRVFALVGDKLIIQDIDYNKVFPITVSHEGCGQGSSFKVKPEEIDRKLNKHHKLISEYSDDWKTIENPWQFWETRYPNQTDWVSLLDHPYWDEDAEYRRKTEN